MEIDKYRECLLDAVEKLKVSRQIIFNGMLNLTMVGELSEWNDDIPVGEVFFFEKELFENCNDINVQMLQKLLDEIDNTTNSIENINNLPGTQYDIDDMLSNSSWNTEF